ncbi:MAG TPA: carboxypeptidase regulatory-like domain-containing protein [Candidatus Limnocylindria bacterium]|nr:carboxypeptidase regulatory-like domain-containing protein [Candidatus Limnocylindria bacterium]
MRRWLVAAGLALAVHARAAIVLTGEVRDEAGRPVAGAWVTARSVEAARETTVYTADDGSFRTPPLDAGLLQLRARAYGYQDHAITLEPSRREVARTVTLTLTPETDGRALAWQLPAHRWLDLALAKMPDDAMREEFVRQCTFCHQQGSWATRVQREEAEWRKLMALMARMGGVLSPALREQLPAILNAAWDDASYVPALAERFAPPPPPPPEARRAVITEWDVGITGSMPHDAAVGPGGIVYAVDMTQDRLYRLDPRTGERREFTIPGGGLPLGGVFAGRQPIPANANAHVGPHSLQVAPDGGVWITLALGNQLARFDPGTERFEIVALPDGYYPHTLRFDAAGRIWYTLAISNHVAMYDPRTREHRTYRLPARTWGQELVVRAIPFVLWLQRKVDLDPERAGDGPQLPIPYGIDIAPDGGVWFAQLNERRIGRLDPETGDVRMIDTPFPAPRRLRFDSKGHLWIPSFSSGTLARFDPATGEFRSWTLPTEETGTETPYALAVDRRTDTVWVCGTQSDSLIRFSPADERFTVYPLPNRVTYTREIDFDEQGAVWTCNSNLPAWQIERGTPTLIRLQPAGEPLVPRNLAKGDEPADLVLHATDEGLDLGVGARGAVEDDDDAARRQPGDEERRPHQQPAPVALDGLPPMGG